MDNAGARPLSLSQIMRSIRINERATHFNWKRENMKHIVFLSYLQRLALSSSLSLPQTRFVVRFELIRLLKFASHGRNCRRGKCGYTKSSENSALLQSKNIENRRESGSEWYLRLTNSDIVLRSSRKQTHRVNSKTPFFPSRSCAPHRVCPVFSVYDYWKGPRNIIAASAADCDWAGTSSPPAD